MANQFLLVMSVSALAIGLIATLVGALCWSAAPSVRNLVWNAALLSCAMLPVAWTLGPRLTIQVPTTLMSRVSRAIVETTSRNEDVARLGVTRTSVLRVSENGSPDTPGEIGKALLLIWLSGVAFFAIRFPRQLLFARRLVRRGTRPTHDKLNCLVLSAKSALGIQRAVDVLESMEIDIPIVTGILHPTILLPVCASEWATDELRMVLLHELAHVRRADIWARAAAMIACGLHWFNPLVWLLSSFATRDAELAADDLVLRAGVRPSSYAITLLNVAERVSQYQNVQLAMPLARRTHLADRVHAILRSRGLRKDIGSVTRSTVLIGSAAIAMLGACVRLSARSQESPELTPQSTAPIDIGEIVIRAALATQPAPSPAKSFSVPRQARPGRPHATTVRRDSAWIAGATDGLIATLDDPSPQVRGEAAHALGRLGAVRARQSLNRLLNDPDKFVQYEARQALSELDGAR